MALFLTLEFIASIFIIGGFFSNQPNEAKVITLFGKYVRICKILCLNWCSPFYYRTKISRRKRNFNVDRIKVKL